MARTIVKYSTSVNGTSTRIINRASRKNQHVVPLGNGWAVKREGSNRITTITETQRDAIVIAREIARNNKSELVIHGKDGKIKDRDSYGKDPFPPRDRKH